ncbi:hypothetical protein [Cellulosimicrobium cellulans]|nr:hypothetical protein [Cellulosimicrobium cellulans]
MSGTTTQERPQSSSACPETGNDARTTSRHSRRTTHLGLRPRPTQEENDT